MDDQTQNNSADIKVSAETLNKVLDKLDRLEQIQSEEKSNTVAAIMRLSGWKAIAAIIAGVLLILTVVFAVYTNGKNDGYRNGFTAGQQIGQQEVLKKYADSAWYSRLLSVFTSEFPGGWGEKK